MGLLWTYIIVAFVVATPYFWFKKTNSSSAPIARRAAALAHGFAWPYHLVRAVSGTSRSKEDAELAAAKQRILGGEGTSIPPSARPVQSPNKIENPFD